MFVEGISRLAQPPLDTLVSTSATPGEIREYFSADANMQAIQGVRKFP